MAKDVDLSSREWRELIFEGKNKEFGAYYLRSTSVQRHNKAMLVVLVFIALAFTLPYVISSIIPEAEEKPEDQIEQVMVNVDMAEEEEEEEIMEKIEMPEPEALPEEILNTVKVTEVAIVPDEEVTAEDEIKSQDELQAMDTAIGQTNFDEGTDDRTVIREHKDEVIVEEKTPEPEKVFTFVEQMPQFPGGDAELMKFLGQNVRYPAMAIENNIQGRVIVQFVVTRSGKVGEVKVARGVDRDLDKEAVRVVKSLPDFIPGKMNGQAVNVWYTLPVNFKLQGAM
ncbi:MAG: energy transducer TonB [Bacteroidales bacterium]